MRKSFYSLLVLVGLHSGCSIMATDMIREETASSPVLFDGVSVTVETLPSGLFGLGTYERRIVLQRNNRRIGSSWIADTSADNRSIEVYQIKPRNLLFVLRLNSYEADLDSGVIRPYPLFPCGVTRPPAATYLGRFGRQYKKLEFFPATSPDSGGTAQMTEMQTEELCQSLLEYWLQRNSAPTSSF
ncbi:hypothetical protein [Muricoccus pecuniae]|uniref:Lipoprotein n=1 Tax=Muricoccus pecuniae TaxID=693023 RepID=A0A840YK25_9PROT|nr:hypothetical protein [Roseomonas pecuniae]MBB5695182.1 hypothetical protein [Roseomonas pecuniae]